MCAECKSRKKVYGKVIVNKVGQVTECEVGDEQSVFQNGKGFMTSGCVEADGGHDSEKDGSYPQILRVREKNNKY